MHNNGILMVLSGPAGSGKDTVLGELYKLIPEMKQSVSMTTRLPRDGEIDGVDYYFVSKEEFETAIKDGKMLEYAQYGSNFYGTPKEPVDRMLNEGKIVVLKIEVQGAENIRKIYPDLVTVFITPPNMSVLESRLRRRGTESEEDIRHRLEIAADELSRIEEYNYIVINDELENVVNDVKTIISAEKLKVSRRNKIISEVKNYV